MIEIKGLGPGFPIHPDEIEKERLREIKSRLGKVAYTLATGNRTNPPVVSYGITRSEGALKWIEQTFSEDKWKNS